MNEVAEHLRRCEEALLDPAVRRDRAQVEQLLADDFQEFGSSGWVWNREQIFDLLATEAYTPPAVEDFACIMLSETVALVTYRSVRAGLGPGERSISLRSSIWTRVKTGARDCEGWVLRFHQGTRVS